MLFLFLVFVFDGLLMMGISIPMMQRRIKPNLYYGFRTPKTRSSPEIWYAANAYSGEQLFRAGIANTLVAIVLFLWPGISLTCYAVSVAFATMISVSVALISSFSYLKRL